MLHKYQFFVGALIYFIQAPDWEQQRTQDIAYDVHLISIMSEKLEAIAQQASSM